MPILGYTLVHSVTIIMYIVYIIYSGVAHGLAGPVMNTPLLYCDVTSIEIE